MENDFDPPSFLGDEPDYLKENYENNIITNIPMYENSNNKNKTINKSSSKSKISISAVDKNKPNISINSNSTLIKKEIDSTILFLK